MLSNTDKTREQLIDEIKVLKQKLAKSEKLEAKLKDGNKQLNTGNQQLQSANQRLKKNEAIVNKNMTLLHAILESPHGMIIFALDKEYRYTAFTSQHKQIMKKIWGVEIKIGMSMLETILDPVDREKAKKNFDKALHGEHLVLVEEYGDKHLQRLFWENRYAPVYNEQNEIIGLSVFVIDITERKTAEEKLNIMNQQLAANEQQLRAANQQLAANEQQLKAANHQLEANNQQLAASEQQLRALNQELSASKKVIEQEKNFSENLVATANSFIVVLDTDANITLFNRYAEKFTGYNKEEVTGKNWFELFIPKQDRETIPRVFSEVLKEMPATSSHENSIMLKDGTEKMISWENTVLKNENGKISGTLSIGIDITERKKTEDALKENEAKLSTIIEHSPNGIYVIDDNEKVILINEAIVQIVGYPKNEILHQPIKKFIDKENRQLVIERYKKRLSGEDVPSHYEFNIIRKNGEKRIVEISASFVKEKTGRSIVVAHMEDITEKRKYEKTQQFLYNISKISLTEISLKNYLGQIHRELKQLMKADNFYVALYDSANGKYSFPYDVDEYDDFEGLENIQLDGTITDYVRKTGEGQIITEETEREIKKKEKIEIVGQPAPVWLGAPLMNASGEVMGVIAVQDYKSPKAYTKRDLELLEIVANNTGVFIERVKNIENLKKAKDKAEESDRLKSAFLANMSHEIRTPMNGILGFTELLEDSDFSVKEKAEFISNIKKSGDRLLNTVNDIIDISKIETGLVKIALKEVNVNEQIENFCQFFKLEAEAKGLELTYSNDLPAKQVIIKTDVNKFGSILTNLIKNAIKFTDKGSIQVGYEVVRENHKDFMRFFVKDTGIGIPASRLEAIFNRFVQADIGDTRAFEGSGLGLAISKSYVEMLGGKIRVESIEGNGSKFYFTLPYHKTETLTAPGKKELSEKKQGIKNGHKKILIAEDEKFAIDYLSIVLKKISNEILYAKNGIEAVELCRNHPDIDVILMDIKMPVMDGYEATRKIREFNKEVIIIAQTAYALPGDIGEALEAGCNDYISKPIKKEELLAMINHHLQKKKRP